ncbi:hypothetical protein DICPUDRAFT_147540 [Dictyostelium purpureum]|uniref:Uncharacterized protein n=1 Tax=Dictyostelium purpureum TaxID=5786 RepID=F0Z8R6_DICPU|nr:uncharacterized protein DICPUDRAFT_147540 [Dictyostelium purpureum]EGC39677.1 hypothetical protein DICPUDRAFT_147540 [Dictyostelium purpureum]|eukprot:XP_003283786.1 hypothetical protein DICPUDRAFT_147540 [Dictyostelium purpureum]
MIDPSEILENYRKELTLTYDQFIAQHQVKENQIVNDVGYEKMIQLKRIDMNSDEHFFFKDNMMKIIYLTNNKLVGIIWSEFIQSIHKNDQGEIVGSRASKIANHIIYAKNGIAASIEGDNVIFIEFFPPQSLQEYLSGIYKKPLSFRR